MNIKAKGCKKITAKNKIVFVCSLFVVDVEGSGDVLLPGELR
jgi:hypothetical protein